MVNLSIFIYIYSASVTIDINQQVAYAICIMHIYYIDYKLDHFIFQRLMAYKLFLVGVDNVLQSSVPICYLLAADLEN